MTDGWLMFAALTVGTGLGLMAGGQMQLDISREACVAECVCPMKDVAP